MKRFRKTKIALIIVLSVCLIAGGCFFIYVGNYYKADASAGLIFYPGGKVQYEAYAPLMYACAQKGDQTPTITREEQMEQTAKAIAKLIKERAKG